MTTKKKKDESPLDDIFNEMEEMMERVSKEFDSLNKKSFVYGFSAIQRPGEKPEIREFGNVKRTGDTVEIDDKDRRPLVDVVEAGDEVRVVAEMPGVGKDDIKIKVIDRTLEIRASGERGYSEDVLIPAKVDAKSAKATYRNGVLEVVMKKAIANTI